MERAVRAQELNITADVVTINVHARVVKYGNGDGDDGPCQDEEAKGSRRQQAATTIQSARRRQLARREAEHRRCRNKGHRDLKPRESAEQVSDGISQKPAQMPDDIPYLGLRRRTTSPRQQSKERGAASWDVAKHERDAKRIGNDEIARGTNEQGEKRCSGFATMRGSKRTLFARPR